MKWTKFKDKLPTKDIVHITNWTSVWTMDIYPKYPSGNDWQSYGIENREYAWADIPIPEVPTPPKEGHLCEWKGWTCEEKAAGVLLYSPPRGMKLVMRVNFCPICGYEAKNKDDGGSY